MERAVYGYPGLGQFTKTWYIWECLKVGFCVVFQDKCQTHITIRKRGKWRNEWQGKDCSSCQGVLRTLWSTASSVGLTGEHSAAVLSRVHRGHAIIISKASLTRKRVVTLAGSPEWTSQAYRYHRLSGIEISSINKNGTCLRNLRCARHFRVCCLT